MKAKVFISSSSEGVNLAYAVQQNLQGTAEVTVWDQGAIKPSSTVLESLQEYLDNTDFAVFVFTPDDSVNVRGEENRSARDNVILELGLFTGRLGRERCFILAPEGSGLRIPTDLLGITLLIFEGQRSDNNLRAATGAACQQIRETVKHVGARSQPSSQPTGPEAPEVEAPEIERSLELRQSPVEHEPDSDKPQGDPEYRWLYAIISKDYDLAMSLLGERISETEDEDERIELESWLGRSKYVKSPREGETYLKDLIKGWPSYSSPFLHLAHSYLSSGRVIDALAILDRGIASSTDKDRLFLLTLKARSLDEAGQEDEVVSVLRQGITDYPDQPSPYDQLADFFKEHEQFKDAREVLEHGIASVNDPKSLLISLASLLNSHFDSRLALKCYNRLLQIKPDQPTYLTLRANILLDLNYYDSAMAGYKKANEIAEEKQAWILANIGNLYANRGLYQEAITFFNRALALDPESDYTHARLADSLKNRTEESRRVSEATKMQFLL